MRYLKQSKKYATWNLYKVSKKEQFGNGSKR